jgi:hypothetical protein
MRRRHIFPPVIIGVYGLVLLSASETAPPTPRVDGFQSSMFWIPEELRAIDAGREHQLDPWWKLL